MAAYNRRHSQTYTDPPVAVSDGWPLQTASAEDRTAEDIVGIICNLYEGSVELSELTDALGGSKCREYFGEARPEVFFSRFHHLFEVQRSGVSDWLVRVNSRVALCDAYHRKSGCTDSQCGQLHICKLYILGTCRYGSHTNHRCRAFHSFQSDPHNHTILQTHKLQEFSEEILKTILKRSCPEFFRPDICRYYNTPNGCNKNTCLSLHLCMSYITAHCKDGAGCRLSHRIFEPQPKMVLEKYGIDTSERPSLIIHKLRAMTTASERSRVRPGAGMPANDNPRDKAIHPQPSTAPTASVKPRHRPKRSPSPASQHPRSPTPTRTAARSASPQRAPAQAASITESSETDKITICLHNLYGKCNYGDQCVKHHIMMPYMWQKSKSGGTWLNFTDERNMSTERKFCDPRIQKYERISRGQKSKLFDFGKMVLIDSRIGKMSQIRRLSTVSSVQAPASNEKLSTQWTWYWKDENSEWHEYGSQEKLDDVSSAKIESSYQRFLTKPSPKNKYYKWSSDGQTYYIQFDGMYEESERTTIRQDVRRRPKYISHDDVNTLLKQSTSKSEKVTSGSSGNTGVLSLVLPPMGKNKRPQHWDKSTRSTGGYGLVMVSEGGNTADEYKQVSEMFLETMPGDLIVSIERIQNNEIWRNFTRKHEAMQIWQTNDEVQTKHLFHGTSEEKLSIICRENFDWRHSGKKTGSAFGKGIYFATSAKYSDSYAESDNLYRKIILSRVMVGEFVQGIPSYDRPPPTDESDPFGKLYDSCVNNELNPVIYVIFDKSQIYPEYVITYMRYNDIY